MTAFDEIDTILQEAYNAAFCGLRNTRKFLVNPDFADGFLELLQKLQIRSISMATDRGLSISLLTTGIKTDRPFDKNQV